ncbi:NifB/NifX family molybdenum-iron cluster-binding protein [Chloroflexota bacterium]
MRIAISATGPDLDSEVDPRFGRCQYFIVVDPETMEFEAVENTSLAAASGAGIATAQVIANKGVEVVLTGNCGPNAYQTLAAAGVQVVTVVMGKVRDAIEEYKVGRFQAISQPSVGGHFGVGPSPGMGRGMGGGMGAGVVPPTGPAQPPNPEQELGALRNQAQMLAQQLSGIQCCIEELEERESD